MKHLLFLAFVGLSMTGYAQNIPQVPSKIQIADMKLTINDGARKDIQKDVDMLRSSEKFFRIKLDRVVLYMPLVERILKEENIPDDIKYLAIQESSFIPDAVSTSKAVGYWQFKDFTAREVGMRVDNKIDERKNIHASTRGAAKYFKSHQRQLDNWANSVNSHMTGLAGIKKYISPKDKGAKKMTITKKTHWYLKRFIAHKIAFQHELDHKNTKGLELLEYKKGAGKDLNKIAKEFKIDVEKLKAYNKWLIHGRIPGDKRYVVMVPVQKGNRKARQLAENSDPIERKRAEVLDKPKPKKGVVYPKSNVASFVGDQAGVIKINGVKAILAGSGDDFSALLARSGLKEKKFLKFNDLGSRPGVKAGDIYFIKKKKKKSSMGFYTVGHGESLWDVSQKFGLRLSALMKKNKMTLRDVPKAGRVLWLATNRPSGVPVEYQDLPPIVEKPKEFYPNKKVTPKEAPVEKEAAVKKEEEIAPTPKLQPSKPNPVAKVDRDRKFFETHIVQAGESYWRIAQTYGVSVEEILKWNNLKEGAPLSIGQKLLIDGNKFANTKNETAPKKEIGTKTHVVRGGDTFYNIAKKYDMSVNALMKLNGMNDTAVLSIGQELKVAGSSMKEPIKKEPASQSARNETTIHKVQSGESFYAIARKYQISVNDLLGLNGLKEDAVLSIGQELKVARSTETKIQRPAPTEKQMIIHEVKSGDTLYNIARKYQMTVDELKELNDKQNNSLSLGEKLKVYK